MGVAVEVRRTISERTWNILLRRIKEGKCTPFVGAEACHPLVPAASEIAKEWASEYEYPLVEEYDNLSRVAQYVAVQDDLTAPREKISERIRRVPSPDFRDPSEPHGVLADLALPIYVTTNYDSFMWQALKDRKRDARRDRCRWNEVGRPNVSDDSVFNGEYNPTVANPAVFHLFGHIDAPESLVLTEDDYLEFVSQVANEPNLIPPRIQKSFKEASLLFLGYRPTDLHFRVLLRSLAGYLKGRKHISVQVVVTGQMMQPAHIQKAQEYLELRYGKLDQLDVEVCWGTSRTFAAELRRRWEAYKNGS